MLPWEGCVRAIAAQLDVSLDGVETSYALLPAPATFEYQGRVIEEGTIAGFRFAISGVVDGTTKVAVEHVTRTQPDQAPDWPRGLAARRVPDRDRGLAEPLVRVQLQRG